jgi:hypothetical protein
MFKYGGLKTIAPQTGSVQAIFAEEVWRGRGYGEGGGMEREVVWRGRWYGEGGGISY